MYPLVASYQSSSLSREAFCELEGIPVSALMYWQTKYRKTEEKRSVDSPVFLPLELVKNGGSSAAVELVLSSGVRLIFRDYPEGSYLQALLAGLGC